LGSRSPARVRGREVDTPPGRDMARAIAAESKARLGVTNAADTIASGGSSGFREWRRANPFGFPFFCMSIQSSPFFHLYARTLNARKLSLVKRKHVQPTFFSSSSCENLPRKRIRPTRLARGSRLADRGPLRLGLGLGSQKVLAEDSSDLAQFQGRRLTPRLSRGPRGRTRHADPTLPTIH